MPDGQSVEELVVEEQERLAAFFMRYGVKDPRDLVHETLLAATKNGSDLGAAELRKYIYGIARNLLIRSWATRQRDARHHPQVARLNSGQRATEADLAATEDTINLALSLLAEVGPRDAQVITLRCQRKTFSEIAALLGMTEDQARHCFNRGIGLIRRRLGLDTRS